MNTRFFLAASLAFATFLSSAAEDAPPPDAKPGSGTTTTTQDAQNQTNRAKSTEKVPEAKNDNAVNTDETKNGNDRQKSTDTKAPATGASTQDAQRGTDRGPNSK